jgi:SprT protein
MAYQKQDFSALAQFMPEGCLEDVLTYIYGHKIQLKITPNRNSILGNYSFNPQTGKHSITINGTLNKYSFLVTMLHEIAHCICFKQFGNNAAPHGAQWQNIFSVLLKQFLAKNIFPQDLVVALQKNVHNPKASSCSDIHLQKALELYDEPQADAKIYVEQIPDNAFFITPKGLVFKKLQKRRTRYLCEQATTKQHFLFPALYKVKPYSLATS